MLWWLVSNTPWVSFKEHSYHSYDFVELASFFSSDVNNSAHLNLIRDKSGFELRSDVCSLRSQRQNQVAYECLKHWTLGRFTLGSQGPSPSDLSHVGVERKEDLHPWVRVDQAEGLCHRKHLAFW